jgi:tetratricopeptide (TPR) repeat protein
MSSNSNIYKLIRNCKNREELKELYEKYKDGQDAVSLFITGSFYHYGKDIVKKNHDKAKELYKKSADLGNTSALVGLGLISIDEGNNSHSNMFELLEKEREAIKYFEKAIEIDNNVYAIINLGCLYRDGNHRNYNLAIEYFQKAIEIDNSDITAYTYLANMYYDGAGVEIDYKKARELCEKAIELNSNDVKAIKLLGIMYYHGHAIEKNYEKAEELFEKAVLLGDNTAHIELPRLYYNIDFLTVCIKKKHAMMEKIKEQELEIEKLKEHIMLSPNGDKYFELKDHFESLVRK